MTELHRHQCLIYEDSPVSHLPDLAAALAKKLKTNHRCLYLNNPSMVAGIRYYLSVLGINVKKEEERGALSLSWSQDHLIGGRFDVDNMLALLASVVDQTLAAGYVGLFATGDMTWEFGPERNFDKLCEYESRLEAFFRAVPAFSGICQYHRSSLPASAVRDALETHRTLYVNETLSRINPTWSGFPIAV